MKKIMSFILIAALLFATQTAGFAAPNESAALEKIIAQVKSVIDVPKELSVFEYHTWDEPENGKVWNLSWSDEKYEKSCYVMVYENGMIANFSFYERNDATGIGSLSREQGQIAAETFLAKVLPSDMKDARLKDFYSSEMSFSFIYNCHVNGLPVKDMLFYLDVSKHTGKVIHYFGHSFIKKGDKFPVVNDKIGADKAKQLYIEGEGVKLIYNSYYDFQKREIYIFPAFTANANRFVNAETGELIYGNIGARPYAVAESAGGASPSKDDGYRLTPEEQQSVDKLAGLITKDEAIKSAVSKVPGLSSSSKAMGANLSSKYDEKDKYIWYLQFEDYSVSINAKDGSLISFYYYNRSYTDKPSIMTVSEAAAEKTALDFIKKAAPDKADKVKRSDDRNMPYNFVYSRDVDGTRFPANSISVSINPADGKITSYELVWNDNVKFPAIPGDVTALKAFDIFAAEKGFDLMYVYAEGDKIALAYGFMEAPDYFIGPASGAKLGYDGKPHRDRRAVTAYDDISGKWYEETVKALLESGYYIAGGSFNGGAQITQEEFLRYLYSPMQAYYTQDDFYNMLVDGKVITKEEKAPDSLLTRQDAAKFAIRYLGLDKAAKDGSIFKNPYKDTVAVNYLGYAALVKSIGIMQGDANGRFNGAGIMTRAHATVVIYNLLDSR